MRFSILSSLVNRVFRTPANAATLQKLNFIYRCIVITLWLLTWSLIGHLDLFAVFELLPFIALILLTFFAMDYFSIAVSAILLISLVNNLPAAQSASTAHAWTVNLIGLSAVATVAVKLLYPSSDRAKPLESDTQTLMLPSSLRHDLQTPISMIRGYCEAILRLSKTEQGRSVPTILQDNVQAIYRNAQHLEKLLTISFEQRQQKPLPQLNRVNFESLLQQTVAITSDLMAFHGIEITTRSTGNLSSVPLNGVQIRQILLNILRTIALEITPHESDRTVLIDAKATGRAVEISIGASNSLIHRMMKNIQWQQTRKLLEGMNANIHVQQSTNGVTAAQTMLILLFPLSDNREINKAEFRISEVGARPSLVLIADSEAIVNYFEKQLDPFTTIKVKDVSSITQTLRHSLVAGVLSSRELSAAEIHKIRTHIGSQTPILICPILTAERRLAHLKLTYFRKPLDFDRLSTFLSVIPTGGESSAQNVLIVEDNLDTAELVAQMIRTISPACIPHIVSLARDSLVLLEQVEVAAIIVDQSLPDISGIELIEQLRAVKRYCATPIILMSAHPTADEALSKVTLNRLIIEHPGSIDIQKLLECSKVIPRQAPITSV
jgi:CheY-like chemotaxis protein